MSAIPQSAAASASPPRKRTHPWRVHVPKAPPTIRRSSWLDLIRR